MTASYKVLELKDIENLSKGNRKFALDILLGLSASPKYLNSMYFYDEEGSKIFQEITDLPEYYLTQCEYEIFETYKDEIADQIGNQAFNLVELGPGDGRKTNVLLEHFLKKGLEFNYVPIDISEASVKGLMTSMESRFPELPVQGIVSEYFDGLKWLSKMNSLPNFVLFLGSNVGNFNYSYTRVFLRSMWNALNDQDQILMGMDLKKDIDLLLDAYNDSKGVTSRFNLNILARINKELGGNFDLNKFQHFETYDVFSGAMQSYLISKETQTVHIEELQQSFSFTAWEPVHTESSYKYLVEEIKALAEETGFSIVTEYFDHKKYFTDSIWRVEKVVK